MLHEFSERTNQNFKVHGQTMLYAQSQEYRKPNTQVSI